MRLRIQHLGPIQQAELDIRPLTVFVGHNHTGKTWAAYALYGLAQKLAYVHYLTRERASRVGPSPDLMARIDRAAERIVDAILAQPESPLQTRLHRQDIVRGVPPDALTLSIRRPGLARVLGVRDSELTGPDAPAVLDLTESEFAEAIFSKLEVAFQPASAELQFSFLRGEDESPSDTLRIPLFGTNGPEAGIDAMRREIVGWVHTSLIILTTTLLSNAVALPSERKALLSISSAPASFAVGADRLHDDLPSPVFDFLSMMEAARQRLPRPDDDPAPLQSLVEVLESRVIEGSVQFADEEPGRGANGVAEAARRRSGGSLASPRLRFRRDGVDIPLHAAASLARSLAGLDMYLKAFGRPGDLLVIDEPEMNAHPDAQLKIIEFLAVLANHGVRVVITTHSPYIVDHLSNLMQASELSEKDRQAVAPRFKLGMPEAFLSPDQVATYLFNDDGTVEDILDRRLGIANIGTFGTPTEYMEGLAHGIWDLKDDEVAAAETRNAV
ncbi:MAG: AAA family ATPase [Isosphaeraceae bacterium]